MTRRLEKSKEDGPWRARIWVGKSECVLIDSDDFTHDASLEVHGDFRDLKEKLHYAKMIARRLNKATKMEKK